MPSVKIALACATVLLLGIASCGSLPQVLYGKRIAGRVVDATTGAPLGGVHVAYVWESPIIPTGFTGHNSRDVCYHAAAAITDASGHFDVEPWREWSTYRVVNQDPIALVYTRGYRPEQVLLRERGGEPPSERPNGRYALQPFTGTVDQRLDSMWGGIANRGCMYGKESQRALFPMLQDMHREAKSIANTDSQRHLTQTMAELAAQAGLALNPNAPSDDALVNNFIQEHLR